MRREERARQRKVKFHGQVKAGRLFLAAILTLTLVFGSISPAFAVDGGSGGRTASGNSITAPSDGGTAPGSTNGASDGQRTTPSGTTDTSDGGTDAQDDGAGTDNGGAGGDSTNTDDRETPGTGDEENPTDGDATESNPTVTEQPEQAKEVTAEEDKADTNGKSPVLTTKASGKVKPIWPAKPAYTANPAANRKDVRALWISIIDIEAVITKGRANIDEATFRNNLNSLLTEAKKYGITDIYFHVRVFDDALWKSKTFKSNAVIRQGGGFTASSKVYTFDPMQVAISCVHGKGMKFHAWMNPYRYTHAYYWDPGDTATTNRIVTAVKEVLAYDVDGIHFDDYFYHAGTGYYQLKTGASKVYRAPSEAEKRKNVNVMVKAVYNTVHSKPGVAFGISPAGNYVNAMAGGADIDTWLSQKGYVDYLCPQVYWTDNWGPVGGHKLFTDRVNQFKSKNKLGLPMYIGLALYAANDGLAGDLGWSKNTSKNWLAKQVKVLRKAGMKGFALFSARYLTQNNATGRKELANLKSTLYPNKLTLSGVNQPGSMGKGTKYNVKGKITSSNYNIKRVEVGIVSKKTGKYVNGHYYNKTKLATKTFNVASAAKTMKFNTLAVGTYYYRIWVHTTNGDVKRVVNKRFSVTKHGVTIPGLNKPGNLKKGKNFDIKGTIKSQTTIKRVEIGVVSKKTGKWVTTVKYNNSKVNAKTFSIARANKKVNFVKLPKDTYYYRIWVHNGKGSFMRVNQQFKVV